MKKVKNIKMVFGGGNCEIVVSTHLVEGRAEVASSVVGGELAVASSDALVASCGEEV